MELGCWDNFMFYCYFGFNISIKCLYGFGIEDIVCS